MRILQIVPSISLVYGGPSQMVMGLSEALAKAGVEVTILTTDSNGDNGQAPLDVPLEVPIRQTGYDIYYFRCSPFRRYKFSLSLLKWLSRHHQEYNLAHIHALFSPISSAAATVARSQHLPYILRPLGTLDPADLQKKRHLKQLYAAVLERSNLAGAAAIHFTSDQEAKVSERFGVMTRDLVMPLGVQLPQGTSTDIRAKFGIPAQRPILLFMSRIDPKKGLDLLIPALETLVAEGQDFQFVLAGGNPQDPDYEKEIRDRIYHSSLNARTTITGFITGGEKTNLLSAADLFVLPSYYENFGIAVAEAMSVGTPVVISDQVHIWHGIQQAEAGWISACEVSALTDALRLALRDRQELQRRGINAQRYAQENFSWAAIAHQMIHEYDRLAKKAGIDRG
ncbi:MAG: hormogonium polysaccharide biosynthesis glycosyltransferase HpsP [Myxacorys californica WJT36-NPBG1]|jgi:glycosyltransferase involved in cell wall biosynthesis|nr:hormogonium polysaccharide biosynthesis glycosyltransferase HpsP [Myxacorys californica WJT36-NPBG1]